MKELTKEEQEAFLKSLGRGPSIGFFIGKILAWILIGWMLLFIASSFKLMWMFLFG